MYAFETTMMTCTGV